MKEYNSRQLEDFFSSVFRFRFVVINISNDITTTSKFSVNYCKFSKNDVVSDFSLSDSNSVIVYGTT